MLNNVLGLSYYEETNINMLFKEVTATFHKINNYKKTMPPNNSVMQCWNLIG